MQLWIIINENISLVLLRVLANKELILQKNGAEIRVASFCDDVWKVTEDQLNFM